MTFEYIKTEIDEAKEEGFSPYAGFPDIDKKYSTNVLEVFSQRLIRPDRQDIQSFYDFWEIESQFKNDKFYLLGHTQGLLPIDNFEFLADYEPIEGLHFLTDLAGLSHNHVSPSTIQPNDSLRFELDIENRHDDNAVSVFKDDIFLGHIKKIHCKIFHKLNADRLQLKVKAVEKNGRLKRIFVKVYN